MRHKVEKVQMPVRVSREMMQERVSRQTAAVAQQLEHSAMLTLLSCQLPRLNLPWA